MIKCLNCGSTAQIKISYVQDNDTHLTKYTMCGCGAITKADFELVYEATRTKDGTQIGHRKGSKK